MAGEDLESVLLPVPLGPMMACTSPFGTVREKSFRIGRSPMEALRFLMTSESDMVEGRS